MQRKIEIKTKHGGYTIELAKGERIMEVLVEIYEQEIADAQAGSPEPFTVENFTGNVKITQEMLDAAMNKAYDNRLDVENEFWSELYERTGAFRDINNPSWNV